MSKQMILISVRKEKMQGILEKTVRSKQFPKHRNLRSQLFNGLSVHRWLLKNELQKSCGVNSPQLYMEMEKEFNI